MSLENKIPKNFGVKMRPARSYHTTIERRNNREDWGLELTGGWSEGEGSWLKVGRVRPGSPAERSGLRRDDTLVSINGQLVVFLDSQEALAALETSQNVSTIEFERDSVRSEFLPRDVDNHHLDHLNQSRRDQAIKDILSEDYSIYSPKNRRSMFSFQKKQSSKSWSIL